ncbi:MAG: hypothetical protein Q8Q09_12600 [Deltaproteobacteria bacterium]|nr:hypothetical protein [Deltaproteobacteria bacterium]
MTSKQPDKERVDGKRFVLIFVGLICSILVVVVVIRARRQAAWSEAGGDRIVDNVTLPVRRR